ncbi:hypothetical protein [Actinoplanes sp. GCM10030250]|uniref:hypothetical protein n=1 Tax=Actinoplanes sp. GCM10030250 TaxID=3273376 RepID=UPI00360D0C75
MNQKIASLLWLGIEDYTGLREAVAEILSCHSEMSFVGVQQETEKAIMDLAISGMIQLYLCQEPVEDETASPLPYPKCVPYLVDPYWWNQLPVGVPRGEVGSLKYATTDSGLAAYKDFVGIDDVGPLHVERMP